MSSSPSPHIRRAMAAMLAVTTAIASATCGHAGQITIAEGTNNQSIGQPDINAMVEQAEKLTSEGKYVNAEEIWRKLLAITEKVLGPNHPDVGLSLNNLALLLQRQGQLTMAEPLIRRSLNIYEKSLGLDHREVAVTLGNLGNILREQGKHNAAEAYLRRSLAIIEKAQGPYHLDVSSILNNLAVLYANQGQYKTAEPLQRRSLAIREKALGPNHPDVAGSLNNLAELLKEQSQYTAAEPLLRRSLSIFEKALGPNHPDVAGNLNNLAQLLSKQGQYTAAEPLLRRSLAIREEALGPDHPDVAGSLNNLAQLLSKQGQYTAAEPLQRQSLAIQEKALGPDHPDIAIGLNNLAGLLIDQGQYTKAEPLLRRSLAIGEIVLGPDHPSLANYLNNLALLLSNQGQYRAAEPLQRRSLAIKEKALGPNDPDVAITLNNLAVILREQGQYVAAERLLRKSLAIQEKALGPNHPDVAGSLNNLAQLLGEQGQYTAVEPLLRRSLSIFEKALGSGHPDTATPINNLAFIYSEKKQYDSATLLFRRSLAIQEKALGPNHPDIAISLNNLSLRLREQMQFEGAISALNRSITIETNWLINELPLLTDRARSDLLIRLGEAWEYSFGWIDHYPPAAKLALETRLNRQGLLQEIDHLQNLLFNAPGIDRNKVEQLQALTRQLASVSLPAETRIAVRKQRDTLQEELYRQQPTLGIKQVTSAEVAKALPADSVLVEFQRFHPFDLSKPINQRWRPPQYIALVLKPNGSITSVPLGAAAVIDAMIYKGLNSSAQDLNDAEVIWGELSIKVLKPLLPQLKDSSQWFISPDGELNRVPFAALPSPQQNTTPLAKAVQLRLLTTGRELLRLQQPAAPNSQALVMANPNYDRPGAKAAAVAKPDTGQPGIQRRSAELSSRQWHPLPASEREGHQVASLLGTRLISGTAATTKALLKQQGPRVLHVATHGFFVAHEASKTTDLMQLLQDESELLRSLRREDPQLRSGLVLAGANQPESDPTDDGYLTAAEVVTLNLKGTELVVLSACSTGQGEVRAGEGVYGLQRSLAVAGTRSTLLSLWKVNDEATAEFMRRYYARLKAGEGRSNALAAVQNEFRDGTAGDGQWKNPYYWAAWQLVGDWRPIQNL